MNTIGRQVWRALWLLPATLACAGVPFYDGFDAVPAYGPGTNFLAPINGWVSDSAAVQVTDETFHSAPQSVKLPGLAALSNSVGGVAGQVWTDCRVRPVLGDLPPELPAAGTLSLTATFLTNGYVAYAATGGWVVCSNTIWGTPVPAVAAGEFARVTIYQDYGRSNSALFVNSNLVAQGVPFYGAGTAYNGFQARGGEDATSHLDTVSFSNGPPGDVLADGNWDGLADVNEFALDGYAMEYLVVATNGVYTNLAVALAAARPRDVIIVSNGVYEDGASFTQAVGYVTGGVFTLQGPLAVEATGVAIVVRSSLSCGDVSVATGSALRVDGALACGDLTLASNAVLTVGGTLTCTNLTLGLNAWVGLTNVTVTAAHLVIGTGGRLVVSNGTLSADGIVLSGTFTLDENWGNAQARSAIPFRDGFETYAAGTPLTTYAFNGWGASGPAVQVQTQVVAAGARAVTAPGGQGLSNRVDGAGSTRVWTDVWVWPTLGGEPSAMATNTSTCALYLNTNGYVVVYNPSNGWDICTSNAARAAVTNLVGTNGFVRLTVCTDFDRRKTAVFLGGELLREQVPFAAGAPASYTGRRMDNEMGDAYLDEVGLSAAPPDDLHGDIDRDGINDLLEIDRYGSTTVKPWGSSFLFR